MLDLDDFFLCQRWPCLDSFKPFSIHHRFEVRKSVDIFVVHFFLMFVGGVEPTVQARKMLGQQTMKQSGMTFARAVYKKVRKSRDSTWNMLGVLFAERCVDFARNVLWLVGLSWSWLWSMNQWDSHFITNLDWSWSQNITKTQFTVDVWFD